MGLYVPQDAVSRWTKVSLRGVGHRSKPFLTPCASVAGLHMKAGGLGRPVRRKGEKWRGRDRLSWKENEEGLHTDEV